MKNNSLFLAIVIMLLGSSCEIINPSEDIPAYLNIEKMDVMSSGAQGSNSQIITDAWVYVDNEYIGAYPLPARVPVLEEGVQTLTIFPGIKLNGISSDRNIYPFYDKYEVDVEFVPTEDLTVNPTLEYADNAVFQLMENFEGVNHLFSTDLDGDDETFFEGNEDGGFEGRSGVATLSDGHFLVSAATDYINTFPAISAGYTSFVEINFKTDVGFKVGLIAYDQNNNAIYTSVDRTVRETKEWKKIYFDMSTPLQEAAQSPGVANYRIVLIGQLSPDALDTLPVAKVYVDNVKFITY